MRTRRGDDVTLVEENLSTYPGFNDPIVPIESGAEVLAGNQAKWNITLKPDWHPAGITVPLPLRLWNSRCLTLNGFANAEVLDAELKHRKVQRVDHNGKPDPNSSQALVQLYGSDYIGTTLGPFKAVFTLIWVQALKGKSPDVPCFMWWRYYGNSLVNKEFKEKVWGVVPNRLAVVETAYAGQRKAVRLLEDGRTALRMVWNSARVPDLVEAPQHLVFKTVAPGRSDNDDAGENDVELGAVFLKRASADDVVCPFDSRDDDFYCDPMSQLYRDLRRIEFTPATWQCMLNYGGVVKIYDEHGRGTPPNEPGPGVDGRPAAPRRRPGRR